MRTRATLKAMSWVLEDFPFAQFWITYLWIVMWQRQHFTERRCPWLPTSSCESCSFTCMDRNPCGPSCPGWPLWVTFYHLKRGDNDSFPSLLTHGIEIITEIMCGEALGKLECALQKLLCMKLLSPAPDLFIRTEHTRERGKKRKCKSKEQKRCVSISYRPPVDDHHQRQRGVEAALL